MALREVDIKCNNCDIIFKVPHWRASKAKYCSVECVGNAAKAKLNSRCTSCGSEFHVKESRSKKSVIGNFCSMDCASLAKSEYYRGDRNPNFKNREHDTEGYLFVPHANKWKVSSKLHREVTFTEMGLSYSPKNVHVHHRDCDVRNNEKWNLVALTPSDHKWVHKQYGSATLWAIAHGKLSPLDASSWSNDVSRAKRLLCLDCRAQGVLMKEYGYTLDDALVANASELGVEIEKEL